MLKSLFTLGAALALYSAGAQADVVEFETGLMGNQLGTYTYEAADKCNASYIHVAVGGQRAELRAMRVYFGNGEHADVAIGRVYSPGEGTGWLDLPGGARCVSRVAIYGQSLGNSNASTIGIYLYRFDEAVDPDLGIRNIAQWRLNESFTLWYSDVRNVCNLDYARLRVTNDSADIEYIAVEFGDGSVQRLEVRENFAAGSTSRWINLNGRNRCIDRVAIVGKSGPRGADAIVTLQGR